MSAAFSLSLSNPAVTTPPLNVIFTGLSSGNTLDLTIGNNSGFPLVIGGTSVGKYLQVLVSDNVLDAAAAQAVGVKSPWTVASVTPPAAAGGFYTFNLAPPAAGVPLPNTGSVIVELNNLSPTSKGVAQVQVQYQFDNAGDSLNLSGNLSVSAAVNPDLAQLIGDNGALSFNYYVNTGAPSNPIMVSSSPVTAGNAVENLLQLDLLFQQTVSPEFHLDDSNGNLVESWNPSKPPVFRIFFPYFSAKEQLPAALDLTDTLTPPDPGYNAITSAWNIAGALDPGNSKITQNGFWQIGLDPQSPVPAWIVQPLASNTHLFTATAGSPSQPGPLLNLFFSHIFSGLPIDPENPDTMLYFQWLDFPGFNDGTAEFTLRKMDLAISEFTCSIERSFSGVQLIMTWNTVNAAYCTLTGDPDRLDTQITASDPYKRKADADQPVLSSYTLTAVGADNVTQVTRTLNIQWRPNNAIKSPVISQGGFLQITPDGEKLLFADAVNIRFFSPQTLQPLPVPPVAPGAGNFVVTPDNQTVFYLTEQGTADGLDLSSGQPTPGSGYNFTGGSTGPFYIITLSADSTKLMLGTAQLKYDNGQTQGNNQLVILNTSTLQPVEGSPVALPDSPLAVVVGPQTGRLYVATCSSLLVLDGETFEPVLPAVALQFPGLLAVSPDESHVYTVAFSDPPVFYFRLLKYDAKTMQVVGQQNLDYGFFPFTDALLGIPLASLLVSPDNTLLLLSGMTTESIWNASKNDDVIQAYFNALDVNTLQPMGWSPIQSGNTVPFGIVLQPDGSRMTGLVSLDPTQKNLDPVLCAYDPVFQ